MIVFYIFGILLASATGFDTLGLSPVVVESNLQYVNSQPLPAEEQVPNKSHYQECPQNELLVKILNILANPHSLNNIDGNTKTYVSSLLEKVLQNSYYREKVSNDIYNIKNNPANNAALRGLADSDDKKIKITLHYELPASNDCQKSLEYLHKIINALNETRTAEILNFELRTENPEHYKITSENPIQDKLSNEESLKTLFDNPKTNFMDLLQNYRPEDSAQAHNEKNDVSLSGKNNAPLQYPSINLIPINYDYNRAPEYLPNNEAQIYKQSVVPNPDNRLKPPETKILWKNSNANPLNVLDRSQHSNPNDSSSKDLLKALLSISQQQPQFQSGIETVNVLKDADLPKPEIVQDLNVVPSTNGQFLNPISYQNHNYNQAVVPPVSAGKLENHYESNVQYPNGDQSKAVPYLNLAQLQYQPGVDYVNVRQTGDHNNIVEITYVLQQPKRVQYEPVYLIKYRLPLNVFEEAVYKLVLTKPYLKQDPNQLYQDLLASLRLDNRFTQVTELRSDEINHVNNNQTEKVNDGLRSKVKEIEDELEIIKELNSNVSSSDLLTINNGTVENELKRLKRHPVQKAQN